MGADAERELARRPVSSRGALWILALVAGVAALKIASQVLLPLALSLFLVGVFWPMQRSLEKRLPRWVAVLVVFVVFLLTLALLVGAVWLIASIVQGRLPAYGELLSQRLGEMRDFATAHGLILPGSLPLRFADAVGFLRDIAVRVSEYVVSLGGALGLLIAFFFFGVIETAGLPERLARAFPGRDLRRWLDPIDAIGVDLWRYMLVRTAVGLLTGVAVGVATWAMGIDLAAAWGLLAFVLNYIPILGSAIAVLPPTIFAGLQLDSVGGAALVLLVLITIEFIIGNYLDPLIQGRYLSLSPLSVLLSISVWAFIWGVVGAFVGVPITIAIVIACQKFDRTRWVAEMVANVGTERRRARHAARREARRRAREHG